MADTERWLRESQDALLCFIISIIISITIIVNYILPSGHIITVIVNIITITISIFVVVVTINISLHYYYCYL